MEIATHVRGILKKLDDQEMTVEQTHDHIDLLMQQATMVLKSNATEKAMTTSQW
jgi:hypothetical protein